jgi:hypothetical protein
MRGRLGRYGAWQLRDYVLERGLPIIIVSVLLLFQGIIIVRSMVRGGAAPELIRLQALDALIRATPGIAIVSTLLAVNGVISNDRKNGYFRFLFAKPISLVAYYAQSYIVNGAGLAVTTVATLGIFAVVAFPVFPAQLLAFVALTYVAFGGIGFLLSALTRFDWVAMGAVWLLSQLLRAVYPSDQSWHGRLLDMVLPPLHHLDNVGLNLLRNQPIDMSNVLWLTGWGIGAFVAGLIVIRLRPLAS